MVLIVAGVGIVVARTARRSAESTPQDAIYSMLEASRAGDVNAYLREFTGPMREALGQSIAERTEAEFARYLRESSSGVKGIAVSDPQAISDSIARVRVEYVFQDRNEAQMFELERLGSRWKIARADADQRVKTLIPYGTPVR